MKDLALLVADRNMESAMEGILSRPQALGVRAFSYEIDRHAGRDGGVRTTGPETLTLLRDEFRHGIVMLDLEGSGADTTSAVELEQELDARLSPIWKTRAKTIVIDPELDAWAWGSENALRQALGWTENRRIRDWLAEHGYQFDARQKPIRPKEALEALMVKLNEPRSSALYRRVTGKISLNRCVDPAFDRLRNALQGWCPP
jgi:hypothetical protein